MVNFWEVYGNRLEPICCETINNGIYSVALESSKVAWIVSGKDSNNDFYGFYHGMNLAQGRKTGFMGEGKLARGARVFEVTNSANGVDTTTWIRDASNKVQY